MDWNLLITQLMNGLQLGLLLFLLASGLTLIFGIMDFINLSHGSFYMVGAYFCGTIVSITGSFIAGVLIGLIGVFAVGALVERFIVRQLYLKDHLDHVLVTFGLILIFDTLVHLLWGPSGMAIPLPDILNGQVSMGSLELPTYRLVIILAGLFLSGQAGWGLLKKNTGKGVWLAFPVAAKDSADGRLTLRARCLRGPNAQITRIMLVPAKR